MLIVKKLFVDFSLSTLIIHWRQKYPITAAAAAVITKYCEQFMNFFFQSKIMKTIMSLV